MPLNRGGTAERVPPGVWLPCVPTHELTESHQTDSLDPTADLADLYWLHSVITGLEVLSGKTDQQRGKNQRQELRRY